MGITGGRTLPQTFLSSLFEQPMAVNQERLLTARQGMFNLVCAKCGLHVEDPWGASH